MLFRSPGVILEIVVGEPRRALQVLRDRVGDSGVQLFGDRLHAHVARESDGRDLAAALEAAGLPPSSVRPIVPTLEDVFIELLSVKREEVMG